MLTEHKKDFIGQEDIDMGSIAATMIERLGPYARVRNPEYSEGDDHYRYVGTLKPDVYKTREDATIILGEFQPRGRFILGVSVEFDELIRTGVLSFKDETHFGVWQLVSRGGYYYG